MLEKHLIFGIHVSDRVQHAGAVQELLTQYGCSIKTRIGLHDTDDRKCSTSGVIVLEMFGDEATCHEMADKLNAIEGVEVQKMIFEHEEA